MKIVKANDNEELSQKAADMIEEVLKGKTHPILGLATGSTPERMYEILVERHKQDKLSFKNTTTFNLDEYVGLPSENKQSYRYFMNDHLFNHVDIDKAKTHVPNGLAKDITQECLDYEQKITNQGHIDIQVLGIGLNGHIGFNEPGSTVDSRTHVVELDKSTREANARFFDTINDVPTQAITMGIGTILEAKEILLLVHGEKKADILRKVIDGDITSDVPASYLKTHPHVTIITDINL